MLIDGNHYESITYIPPAEGKAGYIKIIDQRFLPFKLLFRDLKTTGNVIRAIGEMQVRGAPLIGITAAFGLVFVLEKSPEIVSDEHIKKEADRILNERPTAYNTAYCLNRVLKAIEGLSNINDKREAALREALALMEEDRTICRKIGEHGLEVIRGISSRKGRVNILTHCNAGWLACVDYGTVTSLIYQAHQEGIDLHVWVDETRPRNQGARLTVWELTENGVSNTLITDNAGGHLMQKGLVDLVLVGCDRVTRNGDVANKIGTYLKAIAAAENKIPFYVAAPSSTIDWDIADGLKEIVIENRADSEVKYIEGWIGDEIGEVLITCKDAQVYNPGFDVTPAKYITGLITDRGICRAELKDMLRLFPDRESVSHEDRTAGSATVPEGVIKYRSLWDKKPLNIVDKEELERLNYWRSRLMEKGVIGVDKDNTGFGNISFRYKDSDRFIITGSQTGHIKELTSDHLALVTKYSISENYVQYTGVTNASSETLSHAYFYKHKQEDYQAGKNKKYPASFNAVIHIHSRPIWEQGHIIYPVTDPAAAYGTPELARSIEMLLKEMTGSEPFVIILGGHKEGVLVFDISLDRAGEVLISMIDRFHD